MNLRKKNKVAVDILVPPDTAQNIKTLKKVKGKKQGGKIEPNLKPDDHARAAAPAPPSTAAAVARANYADGRRQSR
jgi:hypothetical protein